MRVTEFVAAAAGEAFDPDRDDMLSVPVTENCILFLPGIVSLHRSPAGRACGQLGEFRAIKTADRGLDDVG